MDIRPAASDDRTFLLDLWARSVRATHSFISYDRIAELTPLVRDYLASRDSEFWVIGSDEAIFGFIGMEGNKIEALFLAPEKLRQGLGTQLVEHARTRHDSLTVDVNEENTAAVSFYESLGFQITGRSEHDDQGNPHPLLHLSYKSDS